jgi:hypothetical protein
MANRSEIDVSRAVPAHSCRGWVVVLTAALCVLAGAKASPAAGCHVADRPVLGSRLAWEHELVVDVSPAPLVAAPPVLTHPPCQGEVPHAVPSTGNSAGAAWLERVRIEPPSPSDPVTTHFPSEHAQPLGFRLDRPPRPALVHVAIELPA